MSSPVDLRDRALNFSKDAIDFAKLIKQDTISRPIINQLVRSASSIGANFVEAKDSGSRKDCRNKVLIAKNHN